MLKPLFSQTVGAKTVQVLPLDAYSLDCVVTVVTAKAKRGYRVRRVCRLPRKDALMLASVLVAEELFGATVVGVQTSH